MPEEKPVHTLIALHGFLGSGTDFEFLRPMLAQSRCELHTPDLPRPRSSSLDPFEDYVGTLDNHLEPALGSHTTLMGYSQGGRLALALAVRDGKRPFKQRRFQKLILISATLGIADAQAKQERRELDQDRAHKLRDGGTGSFVKTWHDLPLFAGLHSHLSKTELQILAQRKAQVPAETAARFLDHVGTGNMPDYSAELAKLQIPVLLLTGGQDEAYCDHAQQMLAIFPEARQLIIQDSGHVVHLEQPALFGRAVLGFVLEGVV